MPTDGSEYDALAEDYGYLYQSDPVAAAEPDVAVWQQSLTEAGPGARILDCACGTGIDMVALLKRGNDVTGADASPGMLAEARRLLAVHGFDARLEECLWEDLPAVFPEQFDIVLCWGNAISHALGADHMVASLHGMAGVLSEKGRLYVSSRNWERVLARSELVQSFAPRMHRGARTIPVYSWHLAGWANPGYLDIILLSDLGDRVDHRSYRISFVPFRREELIDRLAQAGLSVSRTGELRDGDRYYVEAIRTPALQ